mgnify:CR=1 FL=1
MPDDMVIRSDELVSNPTARVPVCLCLDTSGSMDGDPISELNAGVALFFDALRSDEVAQYAAEIAVVTFGGAVQRLLEFGSVANQRIPPLAADGQTPMGEGVITALELLEARKRQYSNAGIDYFQPWLVLMTDGQPTDSIDDAVTRTTALVTNRKLTIFPIGIGAKADMSKLAEFSPNRSPLRLQGLKFKEFFEWLSRSVSRVSQSVPGQSVPLDEKGIKGWAQL